MRRMGTLSRALFAMTLVVGLTVVAPVAASAASTITVNPGDSIQTAINSASPGDTIWVKPGSYTDKPVRSQFGWHLIKVEDKRMKAPPTFDEAKEDVRAETSRALAESYVAELRKKGKVEMFTPDGKPLPAKPAQGAADPGAAPAAPAGSGEIKAVPKSAK